MDKMKMWEQSMRAQRLAPRTISERLRIMAASGLDPDTATVWDIEEWMAEHDEWAPATHRNYQAAVQAFFAWQHKRGLRADDPSDGLKVVKVARGEPHPISSDELAVLLSKVNRHRTRGYILLAAYQGLRVHEIAKVRGEDLHNGYLRIDGKGGKVKRLPVHPLVEAYAETMPDEGWWFPSYARPDEHVNSNTISNVVSQVMRRHGVRGSAHWCRHWFGTTLARSAPTRVAQEGLRHASLQTTQIYTQVEDVELADAIRRLPALGGVA